MHNCKLTRNVLLDLALGELSPAETRGLLAELNNCAECQAEYTALRNTLRSSQQALRSALPREEFWPGYRSRLQDRIQQLRNDSNQASSTVQPLRLSLTSRLWSSLRGVAATSVRVPVPAALALILLAGIIVMSQRSRGPANLTALTPPASVEVKTVQVPVIQERVVTKVVYVERKARRYKGGSLDSTDRNTTIARATPDGSGKTAMSLVGFKPTEQVKLTIIKGSYQDEK